MHSEFFLIKFIKNIFGERKTESIEYLKFESLLKSRIGNATASKKIDKDSNSIVRNLMNPIHSV